MKKIATILLLVLLAFSLAPAAAQGPTWPGDEWPTSTPEEQGIDSAWLAEMFTLIAEDEIDIDSVLVLRNGHVVLDAYIAPADSDIRHHVASVSKSFTATLVGIAIGQGLIPDVETPLMDLFPGYESAEPDPLRDTATLEDLLTMSVGWNCRDSYLHNYRGLEELWACADWVQFMLDLPMIHDPGTEFEYCNGGSHLLAAAVEIAAEQPIAEFADENLFEPLGITDYEWATVPSGRVLGYAGLRINPRDMARLGYLYLHDGVWNGEQIVPADFIAAARTPHIEANTLASDYGYQWWIEDNTYMALGYGGQYILVSPEHDLIAVFTSSLANERFKSPWYLFTGYVLKAIQSDEALPANPDGVAALNAAVAALQSPEPTPVPDLPAQASAISGVRYTLEKNDLGADTITLHFEPGADETLMIIESSLGALEMKVGLDGVFRLNDRFYFRSLRGTWTSDERFVIEWRNPAEFGNGEFRLTFNEDGTLRFVYNDAVSEQLTVIEGVAERE